MTHFKIATILILALSLASCANTIRGVGKDVKESANAVGDAVTY
ncbi:EncA/B family entericidin [Hoeflea ulvae]|uniref:EncA/B family entericidin n=1 Tax=Hoeflea ulvae TaxID=2983764 RepID=A0ABT3YJ46_9HYPH|nr:EncA/B family entericidin [Hoeflea ulvae]MCY0095917.1 EncA/B family entericidin [Hoeflea ulvae]